MNGQDIDRIAAAVMYEGYLLYPYRLSVKNVKRWTFGVVSPRAYAEASGEPEKCRIQSEVLVEGGPDSSVTVRLRFLQVQTRTAASQGGAEAPWQEGIEREVSTGPFTLCCLAGRPERLAFSFPEEGRWEPPADGVAGKVLRESDAILGGLELSAVPLREGLFRVTLGVVNETEMARPDHAKQAERRSLMATHAILRVRGGRFLSLTDPPERDAEAARACRQAGSWPVLAGDPAAADAVLCSPIILPDFPRLAEESPGDLFDGTEIDEILSLRIQTLTESEKRAMSSIDPRARGILERTDALARSEMESLHGRWRRGGTA